MRTEYGLPDADTVTARTPAAPAPAPTASALIPGETLSEGHAGVLADAAGILERVEALRGPRV